MSLSDERTGVDERSTPMNGVRDAMGLVGAWHFRQHRADGVRVFLGWGQHGQMEKTAGSTKEQSVAGEQSCRFGDRKGRMLNGLPNTSSNHCSSLRSC